MKKSTLLFALTLVACAPASVESGDDETTPGASVAEQINVVEKNKPERTDTNAPESVTSAPADVQRVHAPADQNASAHSADCIALYETLKSETTGDLASCGNYDIEYDLKPCKLPGTYEAPRPASSVIFVLDSSGSMAGRLGNETKMDVAKSEALSFLGAMQEDVPAGLVVYGHAGDNTEEGKPLSCETIEWDLEPGEDRALLGNAIQDVQATGWTPIAATLGFLKDELKDDGDEDATPVIYVVSDGEETCGGDPVAAAKALHTSGLQTVVNVIGFDVDAETRDQLEAISEAGGGKFYLADDARALREQLAAASRTEREWSEFYGCVKNNAQRVSLEYTKAEGNIGRCVLRQSYTESASIISDKMGEFVMNDAPEGTCYNDVTDMIADDRDVAETFEAVILARLNDEEQQALEAAHEFSMSGEGE